MVKLLIFFLGIAIAQNWSGRMKDLANTMDELLPELSKESPNPKKITRGAEKLSKMVHTLKITPAPDADPSIAIFADLFEQETQRAYLAAKEGQIQYSKNLLRAVTGYCIACHSRHDKGPDFGTFPLKVSPSTLHPRERASLLAATRQFDKALDEYQKLISDVAFRKQKMIEWERALREGITIAVRVKRDPDLAKKLVDTALKLEDLPEFVRGYLLKWSKSIDAWKAEPKLSVNTAAGLLSETTRLLQEARALQTYPADHSADILYLRASTSAHELLSVSPNGLDAAKGLLLTGISYEVLSNSMLTPLHELYYQACIHKAPHTETAEQCYQNYEAAIYFGFSGSLGTSIPNEVRKTLLKLKEMAKVKEKS